MKLSAAILILLSLGLASCTSIDSSDEAEMERLSAGGQLNQDAEQEMDDSISGSTD